MPVFPLQSHAEPIYGSADAGQTIHDGDEVGVDSTPPAAHAGTCTRAARAPQDFRAVLRRIGSHFHLGEHEAIDKHGKVSRSRAAALQ